MRTKNKMIASLEIAVVLCSVFLVSLPGLAAQDRNQEMEGLSASASELATASEDETLDIYGNANEDDTIDMRDLTHVKLIFFGKKPVTELADAKYDGKINPLDFIQIKLIIVGKEKELTIVDEGDRIVTVKKPIKKMIVSNPEVIKSLKAEDRVVGVSVTLSKRKIFFPELSKLPGVIDHYKLDYEKIYELAPDIFITWAPTYPGSEEQFRELEEKLDIAGIEVLCLCACLPGDTVASTEKLGYILDRREEAEKFIDWYGGQMNPIESVVEKIPEDERPTVYFEAYMPYMYVITSGSYNDDLESAGGYNIFSEYTGWIEVDAESVVTRNPDIILRLDYYNTGYETDDMTGVRDARNEIMNRPELANVAAVKNERVYIISEGLMYGQPFIAIEYMAKWFHPELFEDLDPQANHQEYLTEFLRLEYDLDEHGVFLYHPLED
jgi:iron complex transport system substrate-binding protein